MRRALIAILMAATAATPLAAQDNGWRGRNHDGGEQRSQRSEQRTEARQQRQESQQVQQAQQAQPQQRFERQQAENRGNWGGRRDVQQQQVQQQQAQQQQQQQAVEAQQQAQVRAERFQGRGGGNWQGRGGGNWGGGNRQQDNASRFAAEREASRRSAEQTIGGSFARQAAENERRYEQQTLRREQRDNRGWNGNRDGNRGSWNGNRDGNRGAWNGNRDGNRDWNRNWRNDNRYDWQRYRYQNRRIFNPGRYYAPYGGYGYNRLDIGLILDEAFFGRNYWIDPYAYHLPPAPPGTAWVRYYNDVLLVDVYSGEVVDVIYGFFY